MIALSSTPSLPYLPPPFSLPFLPHSVTLSPLSSIFPSLTHSLLLSLPSPSFPLLSLSYSIALSLSPLPTLHPSLAPYPVLRDTTPRVWPST